ncbi:hypothetical protein F4810DRAFT_665652 [Camillea tinctor]|nr:hypothetical protein F4810DRAFT_665652 [Camillea tinctor]
MLTSEDITKVLERCVLPKGIKQIAFDASNDGISNESEFRCSVYLDGPLPLLTGQRIVDTALELNAKNVEIDEFLQEPGAIGLVGNDSIFAESTSHPENKNGVKADQSRLQLGHQKAADEINTTDDDDGQEDKTNVGWRPEVRNLYALNPGDEDEYLLFTDTVPPIDKANNHLASDDGSQAVNETYGIVCYHKFNGLEHVSVAVDVINPTLISHLSKIFEGYPGVHKDAPKMEFKSPFIPFAQNWDCLREAEMTEDDQTGKKLLVLLIKSIEKTVQAPLHALHNLKKTGFIKFEDILVAFRPGEIIIQSMDGVLSAGILKKASMIRFADQKWCELEVDVVDWDGRNLGYRSEDWNIKSFNGFQKLVDLRCSPLMSHEKPERIRLQLINRGKIFEELCGQHIKHYTGLAGGSSIYLSERIIVDAEAYFKLQGVPFPKLRALNSKKTSSPIKVRSTITQDGPSREESTQLTDEQRFLAVPTVKGFALESKRWCSFEIANISSISWDDGIFENLVIDDGEKELLLALIARKATSGNISFDDFTKGKGKGLLLLLCGAPGIGKTLTAEAVAENLRRPLYRVRAGDLGVTATDVESSLQQALKRCTHWNAVLLIDEADIFLEQRSTNDIVRSELVSLFLVLLEYYEGIMILTTNRNECIDPAFESRIDVIMAYKDLTRTTRSHIWSNFIRRLPQKDICISPEDIDDLSRWSLNGRQIKSALKIGWTLASSKEEQLKKEHLDLVIGIRKEGSRLLGAEGYGIRYDQEGSGASDTSNTELLAYTDVDSDVSQDVGWVLQTVMALLYVVLMYCVLMVIDLLIVG